MTSSRTVKILIVKKTIKYEIAATTKSIRKMGKNIELVKV